MLMHPNKKAFTLIELSIVLVIIGLITGSVLVGHTLVRSSQVNSIETDVQKYISATVSFQQKYNALPGDFANATTYWGAAGGSSSDNYTLTCYGNGSASSTATCNGNGNGNIGQQYNGNNYTNEVFGFWQHLANAGFITGAYTGVTGPGGIGDQIPGVNCPKSRLDGAGFAVGFFGNIAAGSNPFLFGGSYGHVINVGLIHPGSGPDNPILTTKEALNFDTKYDDGYPGTGNIVSATSAYSNCATSATPALYNTTLSGYNCSLYFITGF